MFSNDVATPIGQVRFLVGDTTQDGALLTDEELQLCLNLSSQSVYLAAAHACESMAAKVASNLTDIVLGSLRINETSKAEALRTQADRFRTLENEMPAFAAVEQNLSDFSALQIIRNYVLRTDSWTEAQY